MSTIKEPKSAVIRARCPSSLKNELEEVARMQKIDPADVLRHAVYDYINKVRAVLAGQLIPQV